MTDRFCSCGSMIQLVGALAIVGIPVAFYFVSIWALRRWWKGGSH